MRSKFEEAIRLRAQGQAERAITIFAQLLEEEPNNAELLYQMAWAHDNLGLEKQAVRGKQLRSNRGSTNLAYDRR